MVERLIFRGCGLSAVAVVACVALGCGSGSGSGPVAQAASQSLAAPSVYGPIKLTEYLVGVSRPVVIAGSVASTGGRRRASVTLAYVSRASGYRKLRRLQLEFVTDGDVEYIGSPLLAGRLVDSRQRWMEAHLKHGSEQASGDSRADLTMIPAAYLRLVRSLAQSLRVVDRETVDGYSATRYHAVIDPVRLARAEGTRATSAEQSPSIDAWIDASHRIRRISVTRMWRSQHTGDPATAQQVVGFNYGHVEPIQTPPASEVLDSPHAPPNVVTQAVVQDVQPAQ